MNFEEIKENWKRDNSYNNIQIEMNEQTQKRYQSPIKRIKYRMIQEFIGTWAVMIGLIIAFFKLQIFNSFSIYFLIGSIVLIAIPTIYYHYKFYRFYRDFFIQNISTYSNLRRFSRKMSEFISNYREYNYFIILIAGNFVYRIYDKLGKIKVIIGEQRDKDIESLIFLAFIFSMVVISTEIIIYFFYKRPLNQVNSILIELEDTEEDFLKNDTPL